MCKVTLEKPIMAIKPEATDDKDRIEFTDGSYITFSHHQECCEENYADLTCLDDTDFYNREFSEISLEEWEGGIRVNGYAINCYSEQNGCYDKDIECEYCNNSGEQLAAIVGTCEWREDY